MPDEDLAPDAPDAPAPNAAAAALVAALLDAWVAEHIHNSPVSRDTDAYNHLVATALPELKRRIIEVL